MRTRTRTLPCKVSGHEWQTSYTGTPISGAFGTRYCLPAVPISGPADMGLLYSWPSSTSTIVDQCSSGSGFHLNDVQHDKITISDPAILDRVSNGSLVRESYYSNDWYYYPSPVCRSIASMYYGLRDCQQVGYFSTNWTNPVVALSHLPASPASMQDDLVRRIVSRVGGFHLTTALWETRDLPELAREFTRRGAIYQSLQELGRLFYSGEWINLANDLRKAKLPRQRKRIVKLMKDLASGQLAYLFGLMPTISDCKSVIKALDRVKQDKRHRTTFSVASAAHSSDGKNQLVSGSGKGSYDHCLLHEQVVSTRVDGCDVTVTSPCAADYHTNFFKEFDRILDNTIGIQNPANLIWEVIPFSWAVNWLLNIDGLLDAMWLETAAPLDLHYWTSLKTELDVNIQGMYSPVLKRTPSVFAPEWRPWPVPIHIVRSSYTRKSVPGPSVLGQLKTKGATISNIYKLILVALGFI